MKPLAELTRFLAKASARMAALRLFSAQIDIDVAGDIARDIEKARASAVKIAHQARYFDEEAISALRSVLSDGVVTPCELPQIQLALTKAEKSAALDHQLMEALS